MDRTWYKSERLIGGIAYHLYKSNKIMLDYDHQEGGSFLGDKTFRFDIVFEVVF